MLAKRTFKFNVYHTLCFCTFPGMGMGMGMGGMMPGQQQRMPGMMPGMGMGMGMMPPNSMMGMTSMAQMGGGGGMMGGGMINTMPGMMGANPGMMGPNPGMMGMAGMPGAAMPVVPGVQPSLVPMGGAPTPPPTHPVPAAAAIEWAIPQQKRVGYMAQFQVIIIILVILIARFPCPKSTVSVHLRWLP